MSWITKSEDNKVKDNKLNDNKVKDKYFHFFPKPDKEAVPLWKKEGVKESIDAWYNENVCPLFTDAIKSKYNFEERTKRVKEQWSQCESILMKNNNEDEHPTCACPDEIFEMLKKRFPLNVIKATRCCAFERSTNEWKKSPIDPKTQLPYPNLSNEVKSQNVWIKQPCTINEQEFRVLDAAYVLTKFNNTNKSDGYDSDNSTSKDEDSPEPTKKKRKKNNPE